MWGSKWKLAQNKDQMGIFAYLFIYLFICLFMGLKGFESYGCLTVYNLFWFEIMSFFFFFSTTFGVCLETTYLAEIRNFLLKVL